MVNTKSPAGGALVAVRPGVWREAPRRDLQPTNILVTDQDDRAVVKIIDFGVAKAIGPHVTTATMETQIGALLGTPEYMSPEQAGLTQTGVDTRSDIYSLGVVLLEWITNRALEKEPAHRYPSASELRADVRRHLDSERPQDQADAASGLT